MKKIIVYLLIISTFTFSVNADISSVASTSINSRVATEYYSDDLYSEPADFAATVPINSVPQVKAKSTILMEQSTGKVLCENNADEKLPPASVTKIMTLLLVTEAIDNGKINLNDKVTTSEHAASMGGSQIWLEVGETMTVDELLKAAAVASANDASVSLAEYVAGSEEGFVASMNERAKQLGMKNTCFKNACGLDEEGHYTSARDIAIMSKELLSHDTIKKYTSLWMDSLREGKTELVNTNKLVRFYLGATGLKTGTTDKAGCCLAASAKRDNMELIAVVLNAENSNERFTGAKKLLDYGFANYSIATPKADTSQISEIKVNNGVKSTAKIEVEEIKPILLKKEEQSKIKSEIIINDSVDAPMEQGTQVGKLIFSVENKLICEFKIKLSENIEKISWSFSFCKLISSIFAL